MKVKIPWYWIKVSLYWDKVPLYWDKVPWREGSIVLERRFHCTGLWLLSL